MKQRITVIFMCICLIITMLPTTVSAQTYTEGQLYWIWNSEGVKWNADESRITDGTRSFHLEEPFRNSYEGYFTYYDGEGYVPVEVETVGAADFSVKSAEAEGSKVYSITFPPQSASGVVTASINNEIYSIKLQSCVPYCGFFKTNERTEQSYCSNEIDLSKEERTFYYLEENAESEEITASCSFEIEQYDENGEWIGCVDAAKDSNIEIEEPQHTADGICYWKITLKEGFKGNQVYDEGRATWLRAESSNGGGDWIQVYDHMHQDGPANCKICSEDKLLWIWDDERMFVSKDADGLPVLKGVQELDNSSFYLEPDVGETRSGYFAYYDGEILRPVNVEISDGKTTVEKDADERPYLTRLTFAEAEYDIPVTYSNRGKNYSNMIKVCLPLAGFYTTARKDVKTFAPELSANKNNGVYYLVSDDFYKDSGEQVLYFDEQLIPAYDASVGSKSATVKNIKITAMANNIWKFEITDAYEGEEDTNVLEGNSSWFRYRLELKSHDSDDVYENEICIYDKNSTVKNQLFYIDKRNVKTLGNGGGITPKHLYDVQKTLILEPNERKIGYFAYYNGKDFVAVKPSKLPQNFQATKLEDDEYLYAIEADNNSAEGEASWGQYSMDFKVELPWAGLYSAISGGGENYHGYQLLPTQQSSYYLICEGGTYDSYALKIEYDDLKKAGLAVKGMEAEKIDENTNGKQVWKITVTKDFNGTYWDEEFGRYDNILFCISASKGISTDEYSFCTEIYEQKRPWIKGNLIGSKDAIDSADALYLRRAVANWPGYQAPKEIADLNADGKVDIGDINILERHIAGWKGYENLPVTADPLPVAEN